MDATDTPPDTIRFIERRATDEQLALADPIQDGRLPADEAAEAAAEMLEEVVQDLREGITGWDAVDKL